MRLIPSDPDLETIVGRIRDQSLDLQPEFQRGAVWSRPKQRLLVDSILRNWYIPPVHVVRTSEDEQEVLDGQQRLRAIFEFVLGRFPADGHTEPHDSFIARLDGLRYDELPERVRRRFDRFTIRVFELVDYEPEEPYELFFRLNQPTTLTAAEKRNAFFGEARAQIRLVTEYAERAGMLPERIGFSNARLSYEDVIARFVWTLEAGSLAEKVTAARVTQRYRDPTPIPSQILDQASEAIDTVFRADALDAREVRLNKATAHSWLVFAARAHRLRVNLDEFDGFLHWVEVTRLGYRHTARPTAAFSPDSTSLVLSLFNDRATSRVNDVSSVLIRDAALWILASQRSERVAVPESAEFLSAVEMASTQNEAEEGLLRRAVETGWASLP